jgi:ABC-type multidrug transport system ATPase subunit/pSer/pThr/pTyr-binding forkhead associated (FHA) protein/ABC-type multidrug transport system permease subunit
LRGEPGWELEIGGYRIRLPERSVILGRDPECDIPIEDERVSWQHLKLELIDGTPVVTDLGSSNGTYMDGTRMDLVPQPVTREAIIQVGRIRARLREAPPLPSAAKGRFRRVTLGAETLRIGRADENDIVLAEPNVSRYHAELRPGDPPVLVDLGSRNGVRVGDELVRGSAPLHPGVRAGIGPFSLRHEQGELIVFDERGGQSLKAEQVAVQIGTTMILHSSSLNVAPGEFAALIGPSGSGKTTLLRCLAGVVEPSAGRIKIGTDPLALRLTDVGYVPQSDVVHDRLTVWEALRFAARLRLPSDSGHDEIDAAVEDVLGELRLRERAQTKVGDLSGGQRKRVACGVELIGKPTMLMLDEPTSGLDPALERRLMLTMRRLADSGRGIVVVTHATSSLALCDTVAVMGPGGHLLFAGSPRDSLEHFQVRDYDEIYDALDLASVTSAVADPQLDHPPRARRRAPPRRSLATHTRTLTSRYARTLSRDKRTLWILIGQAPVIALLVGLLYPLGSLRLPDAQPTRSAQFVFLLVTAALWLGLIDSCREIVKERSIISRELAIGVRLDAYLVAKSSLLFLLSFVQCALLVVVATAVQPLHTGLPSYFGLLALLILASWSTVALGLVVSTVARSVDQATSMIPLLLIPQLLLGAALVPLARMSSAVRAVADLMVSRWAFAGSGNLIHMNTRLADAPSIAALSGYGKRFFALSPVVAATVLAGFTVLLLSVTGALLISGQRRGD